MHSLVFGWGTVTQVAVKALRVEPVHPRQRGEFDIGDRAPRALAWAGSVAGVALLVLGPGTALDPIGITAALAGEVLMAVGVVLTKRWYRPVDLIAFTGWQLAVGGLALIPVVLATEGLPGAITGTNIAGFVCLQSSVPG